MQRRSFLIHTGSLIIGLCGIPGRLPKAAIAQNLASTNEPTLEILSSSTATLRQIPRKLKLTIGFGEALSKIEIIDAISALSEFKSIEIIKPESPQIQADYIFTKPTADSDRYGLIEGQVYQNTLASDNTPAPETPALETPAPDLQSLNTQTSNTQIPNAQTLKPHHNFVDGTLSESGEAIKITFRRLAPQLRSLQARKLLQATIQRDPAVGLKVIASLNRVDETWGYGKNIANQSVIQGDRLRYQVQNLEDEPLYWLLWQYSEEGKIVLPPLSSSLGVIAAKTTQPLMSGIGRPDWTLQNIEKTETFLICSTTPFTTTYEQLTQGKVDLERFVHNVSDPMAIAKSILTDLQVTPSSETADYTLDLTKYMTFLFTYEVTTKGTSEKGTSEGRS